MESQRDSLDTLQIMQGGPSDEKFLFSDNFPLRSCRIQDRTNDKVSAINL